jgi:hypothetical protein
MLRGVVLLAISAIVLSGCVSDGVGTDFASVAQKIGPPRAGQSRIVVFQAKREGLSMALCGCDVAIDGSPIGRVTVGKYVYTDRPAGRHQLVVTESMFPGETKLETATVPGRTYYFLVRTSERHDAVTGGAVVAGLAGMLVTTVVTADKEGQGPAQLIPLDESVARTALVELEPGSS